MHYNFASFLFFFAACCATLYQPEKHSARFLLSPLPSGYSLPMWVSYRPTRELRIYPPLAPKTAGPLLWRCHQLSCFSLTLFTFLIFYLPSIPPGPLNFWHPFFIYQTTPRPESTHLLSGCVLKFDSESPSNEPFFFTQPQVSRRLQPPVVPLTGTYIPCEFN